MSRANNRNIKISPAWEDITGKPAHIGPDAVTFENLDENGDVGGGSNQVAAGNHNHDGVYEPAFSKNPAFNKNFGSVAGTVCQGNDSRLSNARIPLSHLHDIANVTGLMDALNGKADSGHDHHDDYDPLGAAASHVLSHENAYIHGNIHVPHSDDETQQSIGNLISGASAITSPADSDSFGLSAYSESGILKKTTWLNLKTTLKSYFDTLYNYFSGSWNDLTDKPSAFPPSTHGHSISAIAGLQSELDDKSDDGHTHDGRYYTEVEVNTLLSGKSNTSHDHDSDYEPKNSNIQSHISSTSNPHGVSKAQVGLGNVDNTSDADKPVSTAQQAALNGKADSGHNHDNVYEPAFPKNSAFNKNFGTAAGTVCEGDDSRLSNPRIPIDNSVDTSKLAARYKSIVGMSGSVATSVVDWSVGQVFTKTLSANTALTFSNLHVGVKDLEITGDFTLALPSGFKLISGEYDGSVMNLIQVVCTDPSTPKGWVVISQEES